MCRAPSDVIKKTKQKRRIKKLPIFIRRLVKLIDIKRATLEMLTAHEWAIKMKYHYTPTMLFIQHIWWHFIADEMWNGFHLCLLLAQPSQRQHITHQSQVDRYSVASSTKTVFLKAISITCGTTANKLLEQRRWMSASVSINKHNFSRLSITLSGNCNIFKRTHSRESEKTDKLRCNEIGKRHKFVVKLFWRAIHFQIGALYISVTLCCAVHVCTWLFAQCYHRNRKSVGISMNEVRTYKMYGWQPYSHLPLLFVRIENNKWKGWHFSIKLPFLNNGIGKPVNCSSQPTNPCRIQFTNHCTLNTARFFYPSHPHIKN